MVELKKTHAKWSRRTDTGQYAAGGFNLTVTLLDSLGSRI